MLLTMFFGIALGFAAGYWVGRVDEIERPRPSGTVQ